MSDSYSERRREIESWSAEDQARAFSVAPGVCKCGLPGFACATHGTYTRLDGVMVGRDGIEEKVAGLTEDEELAQLEARRKAALLEEMSRPCAGPTRPPVRWLPGGK